MKDQIQIRKNGTVIAYKSSVQYARRYLQSLFDKGKVLPDDIFSLYILTLDYKFLTLA